MPGKFLAKGGLLQIRVAEAGDAEAVTRVINAAFRKAEGFLIDRDRIDLPTVQALFDSGTFLVAEENDVVAGCVHVEMRDERSYLGLLSVNPDGQKSGVGSKLMTAAEDYCAKHGSHFMDLRIVNVRQELPEFYRRRGYVETGTSPFTPGLEPKVPCHFVNMAKPLR
jgi:N-acetylglutamate synthase-like GNAT family acetyltransferase